VIRKLFISFLFVIGVMICFIIVLMKLSPGKTSAFYDAHYHVKPKSIASLQTVRLGAMDQWVLLRGQDTSNPVLLTLHGGPGTAEMLLYRKYLADLEKHFIVAIWDQLGAGKSYYNNIPKESMCVDSFVSNTIELSQWLGRRFGKKKIYLLGHSWGTILGIKAIRKHPELYAAYIGVGQISNFDEGEKISYQFALKTAQEKNIVKAVKELTAIGSPPYTDDSNLSKIGVERQWITRFGADTHGKTGYGFLLPTLLCGQEYTLKEKYNFLLGIQYSLKLVWPKLNGIDFFVEASELNVPVYFCEGRYDYVVPSVLAERYFNQLKAPQKRWIWFENSSHNPHAEEPMKFVRLLSDVVLKETSDKE
jgi:pimeloyl-ACP methyl ester carboxylesterase